MRIGEGQGLSVAFKAEDAGSRLTLEFDPSCTAFPSIKDGDVGRGAERQSEGLYFLRSQAAVRDTAASPEQVFGDWTLLQEMDKPLCKLTL